ncbi:ABC-type transport auxiliary lipoprotein family protein [Thermodesulfobacteriota bacterium]
MKHVSKIVFCLIIVIFVFGGCLGPKHPDKKIDYYTIEYAPPKAKGFTPLPVIIRIGPFQVAPLYNSERIVFSEKPFQRDTYNYHRWRANPGDLVTYFLARDMKQSAIFQAVFAVESPLSHTHAIEGAVEDFYELDGKDSWEAVLGVSITLIAENEPDVTKRILFQKKYLEREACRQKNPRALAEAMSSAMARMSETIITDIHEHLAESRPKLEQ